jgi:hypothetical protein
MRHGYVRLHWGRKENFRQQAATRVAERDFDSFSWTGSGVFRMGHPNEPGGSRSK